MDGTISLRPGVIVRRHRGLDKSQTVLQDLAVDVQGQVWLLDEHESSLLWRVHDKTASNSDQAAIGLINGGILMRGSQPIHSDSQWVSTTGLLTPCRTAIWHVTRTCNLSCSHCYYLYDSQAPRHFTDQQVAEIIEAIHDIGIEVVRLSGGEPTSNARQFAKMVHGLTDFCIPFIVNTNGVKNADILCELLSGNPYVRGVQVSVDGNEQTHNAMRGSECYQDILTTIRKLRVEDIHVRVVSMLVAGWTRDSTTVLRTLVDNGVMDWLIEVPSETGRFTSDSNLLSPSTIANVGVDIYREAARYAPFLSVSLNQVICWPEQGEIVSKSTNDPACAHDLGLLSFGPEGISFCTLFREQFGATWKDFAHVSRETLKASWNRIAEARLRHTLGSNPTCMSCELFSVCQGGCPGEYKNPSAFQGCDHHSRRLALAKIEAHRTLGLTLPELVSPIR